MDVGLELTGSTDVRDLASGFFVVDNDLMLMSGESGMAYFPEVLCKSTADDGGGLA